MAKGDVTLKLDFQTAEAFQQFQQLKNKLVGMKDGVEQFNQTAAKGGKQVSEVFAAVAGQLGLVTSAAGAATAAIAMAQQAYSNILKQREERANAYVDRARNLDQSLANSGQIGSAPAIREAIKQISTQKINGASFSEQELTNFFGGISSQMGSKISAEDKLSAMKVAADASATSMSNEAAGGVGLNYARFLHQRNRGGFKGTSDIQLENLAYQMQIGSPGGISEQDLLLLSRLDDKDFAAKLIMASGKSDESMRTVNALMEKYKGNPERMKAAILNPRGKDKFILENLKKGMDEIGQLPSIGDEGKKYAAGDFASHSVRAENEVNAFNQDTTASTGEKDSLDEQIKQKQNALFLRNHPTKYAWGMRGNSAISGVWGGGVQETDEDRFLSSEKAPEKLRYRQSMDLSKEEKNELLDAMMAAVDVLKKIEQKTDGSPVAHNNREHMVNNSPGQQ
ncbi:MAG: hypothetical protein FWD61_12095 [Phycisphaerales bacterium]|nr:hypothetical protein [Phycisphaerales bacterium]